MKRLFYSLLLIAGTLIAKPPLVFEAEHVPAMTGDESISLFFRTPRFFTYGNNRVQVVKKHHLDSFARRVQTRSDLRESLRYGYYCVRYTDTGSPYITYRPQLLGGVGGETWPGWFVERGTYWTLNLALSYFTEKVCLEVAEKLCIDPQYVHPLMILLFKGGSAVGSYAGEIIKTIDFTKQFSALRTLGYNTLPGNLQKLSKEDVLLMTMLPGPDRASDKGRRLMCYLRNIYNNDPSLAASMIGAPGPDIIPDTFAEFICELHTKHKGAPSFFSDLSNTISMTQPSVRNIVAQTFLRAPTQREQVISTINHYVKNDLHIPLDVISQFAKTGNPLSRGFSASLPDGLVKTQHPLPDFKVDPLNKQESLFNYLKQCEELNAALRNIPKQLVNEEQASALLFAGDVVPSIASVKLTESGIKDVPQQIPVVNSSGRSFNDEAPQKPWRLYYDNGNGATENTVPADSPIYYRPLTEEEEVACKARLPRNYDYMNVIKKGMEIKECPEHEELVKRVAQRRARHNSNRYVPYKKHKAPSFTPTGQDALKDYAAKAHDSSVKAATSQSLSEASGVMSRGPLDGINPENAVNGRILAYGNLEENSSYTEVNLGQGKVLYVAQYNPDLDKNGEYLQIYNRLLAKTIENDVVTAANSFNTSVQLAGMSNIFQHNRITPKMFESLKSIDNDYRFLFTVYNTADNFLGKELLVRENTALESRISSALNQAICTSLENDNSIPLEVFGVMESIEQNYTAIENCAQAKDYLDRFQGLVEMYKDNPLVLAAMRESVTTIIGGAVAKQTWDLNVSNGFIITGIGILLSATKATLPYAVAKGVAWINGTIVDRFFGA